MTPLARAKKNPRPFSPGVGKYAFDGRLRAAGRLLISPCVLVCRYRRYPYCPASRSVPVLFISPCRAGHEGKVAWRDTRVNILPAAMRGRPAARRPDGLKRDSPGATGLALPAWRQAWIARLGGLPPPQAGLASAFTPRAAAGERLLFLYPFSPTRLSGFPLFGGRDPAPAACRAFASPPAAVVRGQLRAPALSAPGGMVTRRCVTMLQ